MATTKVKGSGTKEKPVARQRIKCIVMRPPPRLRWFAWTLRDVPTSFTRSARTC